MARPEGATHLPGGREGGRAGERERERREGGGREGGREGGRKGGREEGICIVLLSLLKAARPSVAPHALVPIFSTRYSQSNITDKI
jgi:hypothetical protein